MWRKQHKILKYSGNERHSIIQSIFLMYYIMWLYSLFHMKKKYINKYKKKIYFIDTSAITIETGDNNLSNANCNGTKW